MTIDSADDSKISNRTIKTNRISNRMYNSKSNRITKLRRSLAQSHISQVFESNRLARANSDICSDVTKALDAENEAGGFEAEARGSWTILLFSLPQLLVNIPVCKFYTVVLKK